MGSQKKLFILIGLHLFLASCGIAQYGNTTLVKEGTWKIYWEQPDLQKNRCFSVTVPHDFIILKIDGKTPHVNDKKYNLSYSGIERTLFFNPGPHTIILKDYTAIRDVAYRGAPRRLDLIGSANDRYAIIRESLISASGKLAVSVEVKKMASGSTSVNAIKRYGNYSELIIAASSLFKNGRFEDVEEAIDCLERAAELAPDIFKTHERLGLAYMQKGEFDKALKSFDRAVNLIGESVPRNHPVTAVIYYQMGLIYRHKKQYREAMDAFQEAVSIYRISFGDQHINIQKALKHLQELQELSRSQPLTLTD